MATEKVTVPMQTQILELHRQGRSERAIAKIVGKNRRTVSRIIERGSVATPGAVVPEWAKLVDWEKVRLEVSRGVQINILAREHAGQVISYVQFWREYHKKYPLVPKVSMRLDHRPGEKCFFDYAEGINIVDASTGEIRKTWLMCGVMAMSSMTYGEFTFTQKRDELIRSMENAFRFFGGVTPYVTLDNQKAAVDRAHWYDPDVNPAFVDFANHWCFAVIPARPKRPQDKAGNECGIGVIQRQFFQEVRNQLFYSLEELNKQFRDYINRLNLSMMKDWGVTRSDRFVGEKDLLKPCPKRNWETSEWGSAKVHPDCHIQVIKKFYSIPFQFVGHDVRVKITGKLIEIFDCDLNPLAAHARIFGSETHQTDARHYPAEKLALTQFSVEVAKSVAAKIGPATVSLVDELLSGPFPLRYLRRVQGILRLHQSGRVTTAGLEYAAKTGITFNKTQYKYIESTAQYFDKNGNRPTIVKSAPKRSEEEIHLHNKPVS